MKRRINSRFTLEKTESCEMLNVAKDSVESKCGTGEGKSAKNGKPIKSIAAGKVFSDISKKRPHPYSLDTSSVNTKTVRSGRENFKKIVKQKQTNKRTDFLKAKALESKINKEKRMKSVDKKLNKLVTSEDEKYKKEKRKSEITGKLKRFKSVKKVSICEDAGDIPVNFCESPASKHDDSQCTSGQILQQSCEEKIGSKNPDCLEPPKDPIDWDNVFKMADEELQKSNELVEIMRKMSAGNVDTGNFLLEIKNKESENAFQETDSIGNCKSIENCPQIVSNKSEGTKSIDLKSSRSKYTLLKPCSLTSSNPSFCNSVHLEYDPLPNEEIEDSFSGQSLPDDLSTTILNLNRTESADLDVSSAYYLNEQTSNEDFYLTSSQENETYEDGEYIDGLIGVVKQCEYSSDDVSDDTTDGEEIELNEDQMAGNNSDSDEILRDWKCKAKTNEMVKNASEKKLDANYTEKNCEQVSIVKGSENDSSEKLYLISAEIEQDGPLDIDDKIQYSQNERFIPRTCSTTYKNSCNEETVDRLFYILGHEQISDEEVIENTKSRPCDSGNVQCGLVQNHDQVGGIKDDGCTDITDTELSSTKSEQFCRCHEVYERVELGNTRHADKNLFSNTYKHVNRNERADTVHQEEDDICSCTSLRQHDGSNHLEQSSSFNGTSECVSSESFSSESFSSDSVGFNQSVKNTPLNKNNSNHLIDERIESCLEDEDCSSDESVKTHPSSVVSSITEVNAADCTNDTFLNVKTNSAQDLQSVSNSIESIPTLQHAISNESQTSSSGERLIIKETAVHNTTAFEKHETYIPTENSYVGNHSNINEPYYFTHTTLKEEHLSLTELSGVNEKIDHFNEKNCNYDSLRQELMNNSAESFVEASKVVTMNLSEDCISKDSSLAHMISVTAGMLTVAVGVLCYWVIWLYS